MLFKFLVLIFLGVILYCLFSALFFLTKEKPGSTSMVKALSWRIGLSFGLFLLLLLAYGLGWITPHGV